ncbi:UPF0481 protein At3g47200 [Ricinus communis]|uniref:UPF0481 protein At3g47200 n=1 Tax=Ricinus communis TaxID=3988 RepID=UPI00201AD4EF|nr:UPF0481 protein At3g47200 [Ricinus communis]
MASQSYVADPEEPLTNGDYRAITINDYDDDDDQENVVSLKRKGKSIRLTDNGEIEKESASLKKVESFPPEFVEEEEKETATSLGRKAKSLPSWGSSSLFEEEERNPQAQSLLADGASSSLQIAEEDASPMTLTDEEEREDEEDEEEANEVEVSSRVSSPIQDESRAPGSDSLSDRIERRIKEMPRPTSAVHEQVRLGERLFSSVPIFRFPHNLEGIDWKYTQPELVTIGPYHRDKHQENHRLLEFEQHKWYFLSNFLSRTKGTGKNSTFFLGILRKLELLAKECYLDEIPPMSSSDDEFVEMMLLDGCFVVEILHHIGAGGVNEDNDPVLTRPWLIPILIRDLLKLDNQLPYFVLELLYDLSWSPERVKNYPLPLLVLKTFNAVFPRPDEFLEGFKEQKGKHLLDLFYSTLVPPYVYDVQRNFIPNQPIQRATQLRLSGVKFQSGKSDSFLDINFHKTTLEIPSFAVDDFTSTVLINCVALEQCHQMQPKYFSDHAFFMSCLINQPRDAAFLCSDGTILRSSHDDKYVADLFNVLGQKVGSNIRDSYLSKQFREIDMYYNSPYASLRRKYCSDPWSALSFYAIIILILTVIQTVVAILSYKH